MWPVPNLFPDNDETTAYKTRFAEELLRNPDQPFLAAQAVFGTDTGKALYISSNWLNDPFVEDEKIRLVKAKGQRAFLPTKEDYAREVWRLAMAERTPIEDKRYLLSLYGDVMGYKQRAEQPGIAVNVNNHNRVMIVKDHGSDADWELQAQRQQHRLANESAEDVHHRTIQ